MTSSEHNLSKCTFLFGSGVSIHAGMPKTQEITEQVLSEPEISDSDSSPTGLNGLIDPKKNEAKRNKLISDYIKLIRREIILYNLPLYSRGYYRPINYEDIYYLVSQISDATAHEFELPGIHRLVRAIEPEVAAILFSNLSEIPEILNIYQLSQKALKHIEGIVTRSLYKISGSMKYLQFISDAVADHRIQNIDFFTLNHDRILEKYLDSANIAYCCGFKSVDDGVEFWDPSVYNNDIKVRLFKLHGSVDWYRIRPLGENDWRNEETAWICENKIVNDWLIIRGVDYSVMREGSPKLLIGTINKIYGYTHDVFIDLFLEFYKSLQTTHRLIISGYSFGDRGINSRIIAWIYKSRKHRLVLISPDPVESIKENASGEISNNFDDWRKKGVLNFIQKGIEEVSWQEIKSHL